MWKFQDFSVTQILREIKVGESRSSKTAIFATCKALNFVNLMNFSLQKMKKIHEKSKFSASKYAKMANFETLDSPTLISRKICVAEKFCIFHIVCW